MTSPAPTASRSWRRFLKSNPDIDVSFAHNDDMGLGAIQAIEAAGKKPGKDIQIVSIDGVKDGFIAMPRARSTPSSSATRCSAPSSMDLVRRSRPARRSTRWIKTKESDFTQDQAKAALPTRKY